MSFAVRDGEATQGGVCDQAHARVWVGCATPDPQSRDLFLPAGAETLEAQSVGQLRARLIVFLFANPQSDHCPVQRALSTPGIPAFLNDFERNASDGLEAHLIADNHAVHKHPRVNARLAPPMFPYPLHRLRELAQPSRALVRAHHPARIRRRSFRSLVFNPCEVPCHELRSLAELDQSADDPASETDAVVIDQCLKGDTRLCDGPQLLVSAGRFEAQPRGPAFDCGVVDADGALRGTEVVADIGPIIAQAPDCRFFCKRP